MQPNPLSPPLEGVHNEAGFSNICIKQSKAKCFAETNARALQGDNQSPVVLGPNERPLQQVPLGNSRRAFFSSC